MTAGTVVTVVTVGPHALAIVNVAMNYAESGRNIHSMRHRRHPHLPGLCAFYHRRSLTLLRLAMTIKQRSSAEKRQYDVLDHGDAPLSCFCASRFFGRIGGRLDGHVHHYHFMCAWIDLIGFAREFKGKRVSQMKMF